MRSPQPPRGLSAPSQDTVQGRSGRRKRGSGRRKRGGEARSGERRATCLLIPVPTSGALLRSSFQGGHEPFLVAQRANSQPSAAPLAWRPRPLPRSESNEEGEINTIPQQFQVLINCLLVYLNLTMYHSDLFNQGKLSVPGSVFISLRYLLKRKDGLEEVGLRFRSLLVPIGLCRSH